MDNGEQNRTGGVLYIVATPIGNLGDITLRALEVLKSVDYIAAEDTRHTSRLLARFQVQQTRLISCHEHNEAERAGFLIEKLKSGASVALVSNAGTPTVSDPGYRVLAAAIENRIPVVPIPGVSAATTALSAAGMPSDRFCFIGFVPRKKNKRDQLLQELSMRRETLIFYESPNRLMDLLRAVFSQMGDRHAVVCRELTKVHEEFLRGPVSELIDMMAPRGRIKGEVTVLVAGGRQPIKAGAEALAAEIREQLSLGRMTPSRLASQLAGDYHMSKNEIYQKILEIQSEMAESGHQAGKGE
ncbi:MAG: 16S rRNA (cytidine(1402)-2'-O)-methyltransferase [Thermodesulfobacteriota bacterium]